MVDAKRAGRSWHWLKILIDGLLAVPPVFIVAPDGKRFITVQQTRLGLALTGGPQSWRAPAGVQAGARAYDD